MLTTCAVAMADSGTVALDHVEGQGRRALSLVPDRHVCVVRADQVVSDVPEGIARLAPGMREGRAVDARCKGIGAADARRAEAGMHIDWPHADQEFFSTIW